MSIVPPMAEGLQEGIQRSLRRARGRAAVRVARAARRRRPRGPGCASTSPCASRRWPTSCSGMVAGVVAVLLVLWFVGGALRGSPAPNVNRAVSSSKVLSAVDRFMPEDLDVLAENFRRAVAGTDFPRVFAGRRPRADPAGPQPRPVSAVQRGVLGGPAQRRQDRGGRRAVRPWPGGQRRGRRAAAGRHERPRGRRGRRADGPGRRGRRQAAGAGRALRPAEGPRRARRARPDRAAAPARADDLDHGADAVVAGFPRNGPFSAGGRPGARRPAAPGEDIYGRPGCEREVYSLYAKVEPGNSGGPLIGVDGSVAGIVFARSLDDPTPGTRSRSARSRATSGPASPPTAPVPSGGCTSG